MSKHIVIVIAVGAMLAATPALAQGKGKGQGAPGKAKQGLAGPKVGGPHMGGPGMGPHRGRGGGEGMRGELMESLHPVELIRRNATEIKLTDGQIEKLRKIVSDVRNEIEQLEWDLERENGKLVALVRKNGTKEEIYAQLDVMFGYENKIKKKHLGLLVVVRDVLNAKQRGQLDKIKDELKQDRARWRDARPDHGPGGPGMMPPPPPPGPPGPRMDF
ncbi:MAG: hypothetical protein M0R80_24460 [Proteobacteria bacterium]|jgi:Spy/CpxP family protein refolding chaperone|nr:hypothetical protein [Pseudomonadota bacterium]